VSEPSDPRAIVERLVERAAERRPSWPPGPLPHPAKRPRATAEESLRYLHQHWVLPDRPGDSRARAGWRGWLRTLAARLVFSALGDYLTAERELLSRVVQTAEALARRLDALDGELAELAAEASRQLAELAVYVPEIETARAPLAAGPGGEGARADGARDAGDPASRGDAG
jgi:hypothetical protein